MSIKGKKVRIGGLTSSHKGEVSLINHPYPIFQQLLTQSIRKTLKIIAGILVVVVE
ncbi:hypothetical protein GCM10011389_18190 [Pontibacillus salipaludis]|uniref:Uncharacterized protein n=1 Tax=Pontibacillus salipaludis TaxID=1697394 RepID=A0ABQ1Q282_9BACI|nr:hypothetical protein GCM10011389_18190 [Pontibacillus salipaludis]